MSRKNRRKRISIIVTSQTAYNLQRLADMGDCRDIGAVVDKLTRDRMVSLRRMGDSYPSTVYPHG